MTQVTTHDTGETGHALSSRSSARRQSRALSPV